MKPAVIVVDLQEFFISGLSRDEKNRIIRAAEKRVKSSGTPPVIVEFARKECKRTFPSILSARPDHILVHKRDIDGGDQVYFALEERGYISPSRPYLFIGGNVSECLDATIIGFMRMCDFKPKILVDLDATYDCDREATIPSHIQREWGGKDIVIISSRSDEVKSSI